MRGLAIFGTTSRRREAGMLYERLVAQARQPAFYADLCVPDTIEGRLELVSLHCHAVMRRMRHIGSVAGPASQELLQYMFDDLDRSIREVGVGDVSVGKYMKRLGKNFYGRAEAYDQALDGGDATALPAALRRNILGTSQASDAEKDRAVAILAAYVVELNANLDQCDLASLALPLPFPQVGRQAA